MKISRRGLLISGASTAIAGTFLNPVGVYAQDDELKKAIKRLNDHTRNSLAAINKIEVPLKSFAVKSLQRTEESIILAFIKIASSKPDDELKFFIVDQFEPYRAIQKSLKLGLLPLKVVPLPLNPVDSDADTLQNLIVDIALDAFNLSSVKDALRVLCEEYEPLRKIVEKLAIAIRAKNWQEVIGLIDKFLHLILSDGALRFVEKKLGHEMARRFKLDVMKALISRLAPFLGWGLLAFGFIYAVKNNWSRIEKFL